MPLRMQACAGAPSGVREKAGEGGRELRGRTGMGGKDGRGGPRGQSFQRRPQGRVVCARLCHSGSLVRDRGFSDRRLAPAGWNRTQHFGSRFGALKPLLVVGCLALF